VNDGSDDADSRDRLPLRTDLTPIVEAVAAADADAFVTVGDRFDDDLRYLTRFSGPDRAYALVIVPADDAGGPPPSAAPSLFREQAEREFVASARSRSADDGGFHDGVAREVRTGPSASATTLASARRRSFATCSAARTANPPCSSPVDPARRGGVPGTRRQRARVDQRGREGASAEDRRRDRPAPPRPVRGGRGDGTRGDHVG